MAKNDKKKYHDFIQFVLKSEEGSTAPAGATTLLMV